MQRNIALAAFTRAGKKVNEKLALQCWKKNICETGTGGKITVGEADGFGGNVARQLFKMEFILQALTYPEIGKIIYTDANLNTQKAISDVRSMIAQGVDVIVSYPDAGNALLPAYREAAKRGIPVDLWSNANIGKPGVDYLNYSGTDICVLGQQFAAVMNKSLPGGGEIAFLGGTPGNTQSPAWQKCERAAGDLDGALVGGEDAARDAQERRLPGPVLPDDCVDLACAAFHARLSQRLNGAEPLRDASKRQHDGGRGSGIRRHVRCSIRRGGVVYGYICLWSAGEISAVGDPFAGMSALHDVFVTGIRCGRKMICAGTGAFCSFIIPAVSAVRPWKNSATNVHSLRFGLLIFLYSHSSGLSFE